MLNEDLIRNNTENMMKYRIYYFDYLRVFAAFAVIVLHISGQHFFITHGNGFDWHVFNFFDSIVRWSVPIFVMISGALFLNKEITVKKIFCKYIPRIAIAFLVWSIVYCFYNIGNVFRWLDIVCSIIKGHYHLWFLLMIIGLYICIPFFKAISENNKRIKYYLFFSFVFAFLLPTVNTIIIDFASDSIKSVMNAINADVSVLSLNMVLGYGGYFILGYYLNKEDITKKYRNIIYISGLLGFLLTILLTTIVSVKTGRADVENYYGNMKVNVWLESVAVFTWFKYNKNIINITNTKLHQLIVKLSKYSFGIYLVHVLIIEQWIRWFGLGRIIANPILSVVCMSMIVFMVSCFISKILNKIPILNKYVV